MLKKEDFDWIVGENNHGEEYTEALKDTVAEVTNLRADLESLDITFYSQDNSYIICDIEANPMAIVKLLDDFDDPMFWPSWGIEFLHTNWCEEDFRVLNYFIGGLNQIKELRN